MAKDYLDSILNEPDTYKSIKFTHLDTARESLHDNPAFVKLRDRDLALRHLYDSIENFRSVVRLSKLRTDTIRLDTQADSIFALGKLNWEEKTRYAKQFKGKAVGWLFTHSYYGNNGVEGRIQRGTLFKFDKDVTRITAVMTDE